MRTKNGRAVRVTITVPVDVTVWVEQAHWGPHATEFLSSRPLDEDVVLGALARDEQARSALRQAWVEHGPSTPKPAEEERHSFVPPRQIIMIRSALSPELLSSMRQSVFQSALAMFSLAFNRGQLLAVLERRMENLNESAR